MVPPRPSQLLLPLKGGDPVLQPFWSDLLPLKGGESRFYSLSGPTSSPKGGNSVPGEFLQGSPLRGKLPERTPKNTKFFPLGFFTWCHVILSHVLHGFYTRVTWFLHVVYRETILKCCLSGRVVLSHVLHVEQGFLSHVLHGFLSHVLHGFLSHVLHVGQGFFFTCVTCRTRFFLHMCYM